MVEATREPLGRLVEPQLLVGNPFEAWSSPKTAAASRCAAGQRRVDRVGGWLGEFSPNGSTVNQLLFIRGATYRRPTIWLYGQNDSFYSIAHSRDNFAAFEKAGGKGKFLEFEAAVGQGHGLIGRPKLWSGPIDLYLNSLVAGVR